MSTGPRKLLRLEVRNAQTPIERKPPWIKTRARMGPEYTALKGLVRREGLHTVCEEAGCPNIYECWEDREATFLIGGEQCTRRCDFCQIDTGKPAELDRDEPRRVAESVAAMGLRYSTVTGVARDDLPDGGAWLYAETVRQIKELNPNTGVELLIPDFNGEPDLLQQVFDARPEVLAHNVETVPRIFKSIRPAFGYQRSLDVLTAARDDGLVTKSNLILGMGETTDEVRDGTDRPEERGLRHRHDHPVPAAVGASPPGEPLGSPRRVRRAGRLREGAGLRGRARRAPGALVVSGGAAVCRGSRGPDSRLTTTRILGCMAKTRDSAAIKAAKAEAKAARKAASKERRSQLWQAFNLQRKEDKRLLPYMIGAFVLIVGASVAAGLFIGGIAGLADPARCRARRAGGVHHLRPPRAEIGLQQGRGPDRSRGVGTGQPAREMAGDTRGGRDGPPRRGAPSHRATRCHLRRRRIPGPGETASGSREEAHRQAGR